MASKKTAKKATPKRTQRKVTKSKYLQYLEKLVVSNEKRLAQSKKKLEAETQRYLDRKAAANGTKPTAEPVAA